MTQMTVTPQMLLIVCPLVFLAAVVYSIGGGGGLISLPAYYLAGLPPVTAAGTNKMSASFGTFIACGMYAKNRRIGWQCALLCAAGALPGAWCGAHVMQSMSDNAVRLSILIGIPIMAAVMFLKRGSISSGREEMPDSGKRRALCLCIGLGMGFYDGFFGPGTGTLLVMLFSGLLRMEAVKASGTAKIVNLASNVSALAALLGSGNVLIALAIPAMACSAAGGYTGSKLAIRKGARVIRMVTMLVIVLLLAKVAYDYILVR